MRYVGTIQKWIQTYGNLNWAVIIIEPTLGMTYISANLVFRTQLMNQHSLSGIHKEALLLVVDPTIEHWMPDLLNSMVVGKFHYWMPFNA